MNSLYHHRQNRERESWKSSVHILISCWWEFDSVLSLEPVDHEHYKINVRPYNVAEADTSTQTVFTTPFFLRRNLVEGV